MFKTFVQKKERNLLGGTIPHEIKVFSDLKRFDIFSNTVGGTIPDVLTSFSGLEFFDIEENLLVGNAFVDLSGLVNLTIFRVSLNQFTGQIPEEGLKDLVALRELWIASNMLAGTIPPAVSQLLNLGTSIKCKSYKTKGVMANLV